MNSIDKEQQQDLINRLKRIEGQVRGIQKMVTEEEYCMDILTQISAVRGALKKTALNILRSHTYGCVREAIKEKEEANNTIEDNEKTLEELISLFDKFTD